MTRSDSGRRHPRRLLIAKGIFNTEEGPFNYRIFKDKRVKRKFNYSWQHGRGLVLTVPWTTKLSAAQKSILNNQKWIVSCLKKQNRIADLPNVPQLKNEGHLLYHGKKYLIKIAEPDVSVSAIQIENDSVVLPRSLDKNANIESTLVNWMKIKAHAEFPPIIKQISKTLSIPVKKISIRDQRTRWASWSIAHHSISINWRLIMAPPDVLQYVIIHELLHSIHPNHSKDFWQLVKIHCKHWESSRHWLGCNTKLLIVLR